MLGTHPHVIQRAEILTAADGRQVPVYYSLGNFVSSQTKALTLLGGMAQVRWQYWPQEKKLQLQEARFVPLVTHYDANFRNTQVFPLAAYPAEKAQAHGVLAKEKKFSLDYVAQQIQTILQPQAGDAQQGYVLPAAPQEEAREPAA